MYSLVQKKPLEIFGLINLTNSFIREYIALQKELKFLFQTNKLQFEQNKDILLSKYSEIEEKINKYKANKIQIVKSKKTNRDSSELEEFLNSLVISQIIFPCKKDSSYNLKINLSPEIIDFGNIKYLNNAIHQELDFGKVVINYDKKDEYVGLEKEVLERERNEFLADGIFMLLMDVYEEYMDNQIDSCFKSKKRYNFELYAPHHEETHFKIFDELTKDDVEIRVRLKGYGKNSEYIEQIHLNYNLILQELKERKPILQLNN